ncbi:MAG TPA: membrane protein insertion efficiency factor YidD, partial [Dehalococcoidia bacterium]|nr:membrane protein insertion efficiency factor YidD [Dehalococcoidia bacterium]
MKRALLLIIRFYQRAVSPGLPAACRFQPTCSRYAYEAIERYGALRGGWLAVRRLARCVPWQPGGYDPVPLPASESEAGARQTGVA